MAEGVERSGLVPGPTVRALALLGAVGPFVYVLAVIVGGALWPGYSQYAETVSTLLSRGAPNQELMVPLFAVYNLCGLALAAGLQWAIRRTRYGDLGPGFLGAASAVGLILFVFPQGPWNDPLSGTGVPHTILAGVDAMLSLLALGFLWRRLRADSTWARFGGFTLGMLVLGIGLGAFGAASIGASYAGLAERMSIGTFLVWAEAMAFGLYRRSATLPSLERRSARPTSA